ncbi:MAG: YdbH domain-containing protein [Rhodospirillaceae bacterium]
MRRPAVFLAILPAAFIVLVAVTWAALPWLLEWIGPHVIESRLGVAPLRYTVSEVGLSRLVLRDVRLGPAGASAGAESIILTYDLPSASLHALTIDRARIAVAWVGGEWHLQGLGRLDDLMHRKVPKSDQGGSPLLPVEHLRVNAARIMVQSSYGLADIVADITANRSDTGLTADGSLSATAAGVAAEATFAITASTAGTSPWDTISGQGQASMTAQSAHIPEVAESVNGFASLVMTAGNGQILISSTEDWFLTVAHLHDSLAAHLPPALRDQVGVSGMTLVAGATGTAPFHLVLGPRDDGYHAAGAGSVSARLGEATGRLTLDGETTLAADGTVRAVAFRQLQAVVNGLPALGGKIHGSLDGRDAVGHPLDGIMQADVYVLGEALTVDDISVPRLRLTATGDLTWSSELALLGLRQGRIALDGPVALGEVELPQGLDWTVEPHGEGDALTVARSPGGADIRARLAVPDAKLMVRTAGRTITSSFARTEVDALLPLGSSSDRAITLVLNDGTLKSKDLQASGVYATVTEGPTGVTLEAEAQVPHLPGEILPLPAVTEAHRPLRIQLSAERPGADAPIHFKAQVREGGLKTVLRLDGQHILATGQGRAAVSMPRLTFGDDLQPESLYGPVAAAGLRIDGTVAAQGSVAWSDKGMTPRLEVLLDDMTLRRGFVELSHMHGVLKVTKLWPLGTAPEQVVAVGAIKAGVPFTNAEMTFRLDGRGNAVIDRTVMTLAEGTIHTDPMILPLDGSGANTVLRVQGLRLGQLVALTELGGLAATGTLHGDVPVELREGNILFHDGMLSADSPGSIRYSPDDASALASGGGGVDLMLQALSDFHYETLRLTVNGSAAGDLEVGLHLGGKNPDLYGGYPLEFNLSLSGALAEVIEGSLTGYQVPDRIRRHMEQFGVEPGSVSAQ